MREAVGVLTEQHGLYGRMTGHEYLDFFGKLHRLQDKARAARIDYLLDYFGLAPARRQRIGEYSKGMKQKLALARALIHEPPVLLLDEPTSAMDPESSRLVRDEISRLRSTQRAIVICTHNLAEAEALADFVAIIYRGRILVQGSQAELRRMVLGEAEYEARFCDLMEARTISHARRRRRNVARRGGHAISSRESANRQPSSPAGAGGGERTNDRVSRGAADA